MSDIYTLRVLRSTLSGQLASATAQNTSLSIALSHCVNAKEADCEVLRRSLVTVNRSIQSLQREISRVDHSIKVAAVKAREKDDE